MKSLIYSFLIFIINYVFFIFISTYVPTFDIKSVIFISALVAYGYLIVKLESRITIIKNMKNLFYLRPVETITAIEIFNDVVNDSSPIPSTWRGTEFSTYKNVISYINNGVTSE